MKAIPVIIAIREITDRHNKIPPRIDKCKSISELMRKLKRKYLFGRTPSRNVIMRTLNEQRYLPLIERKHNPNFTTYDF